MRSCTCAKCTARCAPSCRCAARRPTTRGIHDAGPDGRRRSTRSSPKCRRRTCRRCRFPVRPSDRRRQDPPLRRREKKCWYILFDFPARNGKRYITGAFGRWSGTDNGKILVKTDFAGIEPDELQARCSARRRRYEHREREKRAQRARFAGNRARAVGRGRARLGDGETCRTSKKRLQWENGLRVYTDGTLLVPMVRYDVTEEQEPTRRTPAAAPRRPAEDQARRLQALQQGHGPGRRGVPLRAEAEGRRALLVGEGLATVLSCTRGSSARTRRTWRSSPATSSRRQGSCARSIPKSPILFLADDDAYLEAQLNKRLRNEYGVRELYKVLDAEALLESKLRPITVRADCRRTRDGAPLFTAGIRRGEDLRTFTIHQRRAHQGMGGGRGDRQRVGRMAEVRDARAQGSIRAAAAHRLQRSARRRRHRARSSSRSARRSRRSRTRTLAQRRSPMARRGREEGAAGGGGGGEDEPDWRLHGSLIAASR
jgi:hypothetical protein